MHVKYFVESIDTSKKAKRKETRLVFRAKQIRHKVDKNRRSSDRLAVVTRVQIEMLCAERKTFYCSVGQVPDVW